jgi:hypothetical protein
MKRCDTLADFYKDLPKKRSHRAKGATDGKAE